MSLAQYTSWFVHTAMGSTVDVSAGGVAGPPAQPATANSRAATSRRAAMALERVPAGELLLQRVHGAGQQRERVGELVDVQVLQWQRVPQHDVLTHDRDAADDGGVPDLLEQRGQVDLRGQAARRGDLHPVLL